MPYSNLPKRRQQLVGRAILFYQSAVQIVRGAYFNDFSSTLSHPNRTREK